MFLFIPVVELFKKPLHYDGSAETGRCHITTLPHTYEHNNINPIHDEYTFNYHTVPNYTIRDTGHFTNSGYTLSRTRTIPNTCYTLSRAGTISHGSYPLSLRSLVHSNHYAFHPIHLAPLNYTAGQWGLEYGCG